MLTEAFIEGRSKLTAEFLGFMNQSEFAVSNARGARFGLTGGSYMSDAELRQVKERLTTLHSIEWHLVDGKNGVLIHSDRPSVGISRKNLVKEAILEVANAQRLKSSIVYRAGPGFKWWMLALIGVVVLYRSIRIIHR